MPELVGPTMSALKGMLPGSILFFRVLSNQCCTDSSCVPMMLNWESEIKKIRQFTSPVLVVFLSISSRTPSLGFTSRVPLPCIVWSLMECRSFLRVDLYFQLRIRAFFKGQDFVMLHVVVSALFAALIHSECLHSKKLAAYHFVLELDAGQLVFQLRGV